MTTRFPRLSEPGCIGNVRLKNRILKAPQHTGLANPDGSVTDRHAPPLQGIGQRRRRHGDRGVRLGGQRRQQGLTVPAGDRQHGAHPRALSARPDHPGQRGEGRHPDLARRPAEVHAPDAQGGVGGPLGGDLRPGLPGPPGADLRRDRADRQGLRAGRQAGADRRLRHGGAPRLPRLPHLQLPVAAHQQAHRLVRRLAGEPHALPAGGRRGDQAPGRPRLPHQRPAERHRLRA